MKGVILAGGTGTRLLPATKTINKHLIPLVNKPMILFPLETLKSLGISEILIISGGNHIGGFAEFLGDGSEYGVDLTYKVQKEAGGIAQAVGLAKEFVGSDNVLIILGDNIFKNVPKFADDGSPKIFIKEVDDPQRFGVVTLDDGRVVSIEEKPENPKSNFVVTGLYYYPNNVFELVPRLQKSARGELEITDINNNYIGVLQTIVLEDFWSDAGTPKSLLEAIKNVC